MNFVEAVKYQSSFDAVLVETATLAQAKEVDAVVNAVHRYMQDAGGKASAIIDGRINLLAALPTDKHAAISVMFDGPNPADPRIVVDEKTGETMTPEAIVERDEAEAVAAEEAAKLAAETVAVAEPVIEAPKVL